MNEDWSILLPAPECPSLPVLNEILNGGQSFAWDQQADGSWRGVIWDNVFDLKRSEAGELLFRTGVPGARAEARNILLDYWAADIPWSQLADSLPWRSDPVLKGAMTAFAGLRILRQPVEETLLAFLCSSLKGIPQIKVMMRTMAERFGNPLRESGRHTVPSWEQLAGVGEAGLRACGLGYRAKYVAATAQRLGEQQAFFEELKALPAVEAKTQLMTLPGVGAKIADCVCLFGLGHLGAFPIDTWILRGLENCYGLSGWSPLQLEQFAQRHFGANAGLAQQFIFSALRHRAI